MDENIAGMKPFKCLTPCFAIQCKIHPAQPGLSVFIGMSLRSANIT